MSTTLWSPPGVHGLLLTVGPVNYVAKTNWQKSAAGSRNKRKNRPATKKITDEGGEKSNKKKTRLPVLCEFSANDVFFDASFLVLFFFVFSLPFLWILWFTFLFTMRECGVKCCAQYGQYLCVNNFYLTMAA